MTTSRLVPDTEAPDAAPFWAGCAAGELRIQACARCGRRRMPPRPMCPWCQSFDARWDAMSGRGSVWSFVIPHPPLLPAYTDEAPYNVVVVALDDDPSIRLVGNVVSAAGASLDSVDPRSLAIGDAVQAVFARLDDDVWLPQWVPAPA